MSKKGIQDLFVSTGHVVWAFVSFIVASLSVMLPLSVLTKSGQGGFFTSPVGMLVSTALVYMIAVVMTTLPLLVRQTSESGIFSKLGLRTRPHVKMIGWAMVLWAAYFAVAVVVSTALYHWSIPGLNLEQAQDVGFTHLMYWYEYAAAFIALVVLAPVFEEIMFRGYLFGRLRARHTFWVSAVVTSLVFAVVHMQLNVGIDVFILSMFMCYARERFGSVYPAILMHMLKNGVAYVILFVLPLLGINLL